MPGGFGRDSFVGWAEEPTYGTAVTPPTQFEELKSESVRAIRTRPPRPTFRGLHTQSNDLYDEKFGAEGPFKINVNFNNHLKLYEHLFGAGATVILEAVISWTHTFTLTDPLQSGKGLTLYINRGLDEYQFKGCKIFQAAFAFDPKLPADVEFSIAGQDAAGVAASTFVANNNARYVAGHQLLCEIDDAERVIDTATLVLNNGLDIDKRVLGSKSIDEPVRGDSRPEISGTLIMDALDTDWDKFLQGTLFKLELIHTGPVLGANNFKYDLTALECQLIDAPIRLDGPGIIKAEWNFKVYKPAAGEMLSLAVVNDEMTIT